MIDYSRLNEKNKIHFETVNESNFTDKTVSSFIVENGVVVPPSCSSTPFGGVLNDYNELVPDTSLHSGLPVALKDNNSPISFVDKEVIYLGQLFHPIWGHNITDELSRLWFVKYADEYKSKYENDELVCVSNSTAPSSNYQQVLKVLGIDWTKIHIISSVTRFRKIIIPDRCFFLENDNRYFTVEYQRMIEEIRAYGRTLQTINQYDKIYFSYSRFRRGKCIGENRIERYLKQNGYHVFYPEKMTFDEQLSVLVHCKSFASTDGSCSHNSIFCENNAGIIIIPRADYLTGYQLALSNLWNQPVYYVDSHLSVLADKETPWGGPFLLNVSPMLQDLMGDTTNHSQKLSSYDVHKYFFLHRRKLNNLDLCNPYSILLKRMVNHSWWNVFFALLLFPGRAWRYGIRRLKKWKRIK